MGQTIFAAFLLAVVVGIPTLIATTILAFGIGPLALLLPVVVVYYTGRKVNQARKRALYYR